MCEEVLLVIVRMLRLTKTAAASAVSFTVLCMRLLACINLYVHRSVRRVCLVYLIMCSDYGICAVSFVIVCIPLVAKTAAVSAVALTLCIEKWTCNYFYRITVYSFEYCVPILIYFGTATASLGWFLFVCCVNCALHSIQYLCIVKCVVSCAKAHCHSLVYNNIMLFSRGKYSQYLNVFVCIIPTYTFYCRLNVSVIGLKCRNSLLGRCDKRSIVLVFSSILLNGIIYLLIHILNWIYFQIHELALLLNQLRFNDFLF